jgi:hypothetical protein
VFWRRANHDAADREALNKELVSCKNVAALVEKQKTDAVREGALLRDEIVALRGKVSNISAEKVCMLTRWIRSLPHCAPLSADSACCSHRT